MGNYFAKLTSRQRVCILLNKLPDWFFKPTRRRIVANQAVLKLRRELLLNAEDDWDSALDFSLEYSNEYLADNSPPFKGSECSASNHEVALLKEELQALREQIALLLLTTTTKNNSDGNEEGDAGDGKEITPDNNPNSFSIPTPPPLPLIPSSTPITKRTGKTEETPTLQTVLKDITNVKLKPIPSKSKTKRYGDVRDELYEILKKRYAAMHSPERHRHFQDSDTENSFGEAFQVHQRIVSY